MWQKAENVQIQAHGCILCLIDNNLGGFRKFDAEYNEINAENQGQYSELTSRAHIVDNSKCESPRLQKISLQSIQSLSALFLSATAMMVQNSNNETFTHFFKTSYGIR